MNLRHGPARTPSAPETLFRLTPAMLKLGVMLSRSSLQPAKTSSAERVRRIVQRLPECNSTNGAIAGKSKALSGIWTIVRLAGTPVPRSRDADGELDAAFTGSVSAESGDLIGALDR